MAESDDTPVRFGILGCAGIARKVSRAIALSPSAALVAVASRSLHKAQQFASLNKLPPDVKLYGTYDDLLDDPSVDAVYVPLPTSLHAKWATLAATKGKHLLLEKPTALDAKVLDEMLAACAANRLQFMDASMWYHHPRTAAMKEFLSDSEAFGQIKSIRTSSTFHGTPHFLENDIRVKPDLDALGALGDTGWYCIGAILWAMNRKLPTTVTALPPTDKNADGVVLSCNASMHWAEDDVVATFHCSFVAHASQDIAVSGSNGTLHVEDFIIPFNEKSGTFLYTMGAKFADLDIGWNRRPLQIEVANELPQEAMMIQEFSRLVKGIRENNLEPDIMWGETSMATQVVLDAVKNSMDNGYKAVRM